MHTDETLDPPHQSRKFQNSFEPCGDCLTLWAAVTEFDPQFCLTQFVNTSGQVTIGVERGYHRSQLSSVPHQPRDPFGFAQQADLAQLD